MPSPRLLYIGRIQKHSTTLLNSLQKRYSVVVATSGKQGVEQARRAAFDCVVLDAASMRTPGDRVCADLHGALNGVPLIHIHPGPKEQAHSVADVLLVQPVTARKLLKTLDRMARPAEVDTLTCGPFTISRARRVLVANGNETSLTPKQALLIEVFFKNPGVTLDRRTLMEKVWQTDYLGDTRTLDVHIRWLRQVIELNPGSPQFLRTVRGVGYRLELPEWVPVKA
jgi:DNA-binding response OmpR family regulator